MCFRGSCVDIRHDSELISPDSNAKGPFGSLWVFGSQGRTDSRSESGQRQIGRNADLDAHSAPVGRDAARIESTCPKGEVIFPYDTGHRVKNHIMTMIQDEVLDEATTTQNLSLFSFNVTSMTVPQIGIA